MIELADIPQQARERIEGLGKVELVLAILSSSAPEALETVVAGARESIAKLYSPARTLLIHTGESLGAAPGGGSGADAGVSDARLAATGRSGAEYQRRL